MNQIDAIKFDMFIISSHSPFTKEDLKLLLESPKQVVNKYFPKFEEVYEKLNWKMFEKIDRVYVTEKAEKILGFKPKYSFEYHLANRFQELANMEPRQFPYDWLLKQGDKKNC